MSAHHPNHNTAGDNDAAPRRAGEDGLVRLATYASLAVAITLIGVKAVAWWLSGSVSLLSSLVDSTLDAGASLLNMLAVHKAIEPADNEHRFGHGKAEELSALAQSALIGVSALLLGIEAAGRLMEPKPVSHGELGIAVMLLSIALTAGLVLFQRHVARRTRSPAIAADSLHYASDLLTNVGVIAALLLATRAGLPQADGAIGLAIVGVIGLGAIEIARGAVNSLMDRELPQAEQDAIEQEALAHPEVLAVHDLRTRRSGRDTFIQLHLELPPQLPLVEAHRISDEVISRLKMRFPTAEVMIHQDPMGAEHLTPRRRLA